MLICSRERDECNQCKNEINHILGYLKDSNAAAHSVDTGIS